MIWDWMLTVGAGAAIPAMANAARASRDVPSCASWLDMAMLIFGGFILGIILTVLLHAAACTQCAIVRRLRP